MNKEKTYKILISAPLKEKLDARLDEKKITLTAFTTNVVEWFLKQDELVQLMVAGRLTATDQLLDMVIAKMRPPKRNLKVESRNAELARST